VNNQPETLVREKYLTGSSLKPCNDQPRANRRTHSAANAGSFDWHASKALKEQERKYWMATREGRQKYEERAMWGEGNWDENLSTRYRK